MIEFANLDHAPHLHDQQRQATGVWAAFIIKCMNTAKTEFHELRERVSALEAHMSNIPTKAWVLRVVVGGMGLSAAMALAFVRIFLV